jgi:hypothetical protein
MASKKQYTNKWIYQGKEVDEAVPEMLGFVYRITHKETGRFYIGRKNVISNTTKPPLKGEIKKRKITKESDWKFYWSSSDEIKQMIRDGGNEQFIREILYWCENITVLQYLEQYEIFVQGCMINENSFNKWIDLKLRKCPALIEYGRNNSLSNIFGIM